MSGTEIIGVTYNFVVRVSESIFRQILHPRVGLQYVNKRFGKLKMAIRVAGR